MSNGNGGLVRALGVVEATAIVAGTVIGTGIFLLARCRTR
jgi:hypothetical protein